MASLARGLSLCSALLLLYLALESREAFQAFTGLKSEVQVIMKSEVQVIMKSEARVFMKSEAQSS